MIIIYHQGFSYLLKPISGELISDTYNRLWKIIGHYHNITKDDYIYEQLIRISKLWYYKKKLNCQYSPYLEHLISLF